MSKTGVKKQLFELLGTEKFNPNNDELWAKLRNAMIEAGLKKATLSKTVSENATEKTLSMICKIYSNSESNGGSLSISPNEEAGKLFVMALKDKSVEEELLNQILKLKNNVAHTPSELIPGKLSMNAFEKIHGIKFIRDKVKVKALWDDMTRQKITSPGGKVKINGNLVETELGKGSMGTKELLVYSNYQQFLIDNLKAQGVKFLGVSIPQNLRQP